MEADAPPPWMDLASLACGSGAAGYAIATLVGLELPSWPAASFGLVAIGLAWPRGRALPRAIGAFLGLLAVIVGGAQIALLWGIAVGLPD